MKIIKYITIALIAIQLGSCTKEKGAEPLFNLTPTERENFKKKELSTVLKSSQYGWKLVYFTDDTQLGGFTHLFKFKDDKNVEMASDFDENTVIPETSEYDIQLGSTVLLVFTTKNKIHLLSDSANSPTVNLVGQGYKGDFQFLYYGQDNGEIVFKTNRDNKEIRFVKATANDWSDIVKNSTTIDNFCRSTKKPIFKLLETNDGTKTLNFDLGYGELPRYGIAYPLNPGIDFGYIVSVSYTPTGIVTTFPITVGNENLSVFTYDAVTGNFVAKGKNNTSATIKYFSKPFSLTDDYKELLDVTKNNVYSYIDANLTTARTNSPLFKSLIKQVNTSLPKGVQLSRVQLHFNDAGSNYIEYRFTAGKTTIYHNINTAEDAVNKTIIFSDVSWESNTGAPLAPPAILKKLDDEFMTTAGFYVKKEDFTIRFSNDIFTFTSASSTFRMTTYAFQ
jgi:Domain of unknown function (DUF4302)